jgi:hypothetical protein
MRVQISTLSASQVRMRLSVRYWNRSGYASAMKCLSARTASRTYVKLAQESRDAVDRALPQSRLLA